MGRIPRTIVAAFDAAVMAVAAYAETGGRLAITPAHVVLWGSAASAAICAVVIFVNGSAVVAWAAIGYILYGALLAGPTQWPLLALAAALMPLVPRPRSSFWFGLTIATVAAFVARLAIAAFL
jgi:hypothetical protein